MLFTASEIFVGGMVGKCEKGFDQQLKLKNASMIHTIIVLSFLILENKTHKSGK